MNQVVPGNLCTPTVSVWVDWLFPHARQTLDLGEREFAHLVPPPWSPAREFACRGIDPAAFSQFGQSFLVGRQQPAAGALGEGKPRSYWQDCAEFMLAVGAEKAHTFISPFHP